MNFEPLFAGISAFVIIGIFHPVVIKAEYYFSYKIWPVFALCGTLLLTASVFMKGVFAFIVAFFGISFLWSILELFHQKKRVEKGWFPKNPKRK